MEPDDGGLADYYKAMTDHDAFAALNDDPTEDDFDDGEEYDDKLDGYDREKLYGHRTVLSEPSCCCTVESSFPSQTASSFL